MRRTTITVLTTGVLLLVPAGAASALGSATPTAGTDSMSPSIGTDGSMAPTGGTDLPTTGGDTGGDTGTTTTSTTSADGGDKTGLWGLLGLLGLLGLIKRRDTSITAAHSTADVRR